MLSGGGARAAYQVGFLRVLARECPDVVPGILTGVSAGGINAAYLAAREEPFAERVDNLAEVWSGIRIDNVFRVDLRDLASRSVRWGTRLLAGGSSPLPPARSLVDTAPLRELMGGLLETAGHGITGIARNLESGWLRAIALTASSYTTGDSMTWVQSREDAAIARVQESHRAAPEGGMPLAQGDDAAHPPQQRLRIRELRVDVDGLVVIFGVGDDREVEPGAIGAGEAGIAVG